MKKFFRQLSNKINENYEPKFDSIFDVKKLLKGKDIDLKKTNEKAL